VKEILEVKVFKELKNHVFIFRMQGHLGEQSEEGVNRKGGFS
jgi:hypothetical protein